MTLENRDTDEFASRVLTACPHCGEEFPDHYSPHYHLPCDEVPPTEGFEDE